MISYVLVCADNIRARYSYGNLKVKYCTVYYVLGILPTTCVMIWVIVVTNKTVLYTVSCCRPGYYVKQLHKKYMVVNCWAWHRHGCVVMGVA